VKRLNERAPAVDDITRGGQCRRWEGARRRPYVEGGRGRARHQPAAATISGSLVVEKICLIPGLGAYFVTSIADRDYPVLTGVFVFYAALIALLNLALDPTGPRPTPR